MNFILIWQLEMRHVVQRDDVGEEVVVWWKNSINFPLLFCPVMYLQNLDRVKIGRAVWSRFIFLKFVHFWSTLLICYSHSNLTLNYVEWASNPSQMKGAPLVTLTKYFCDCRSRSVLRKYMVAKMSQFPFCIMKLFVLSPPRTPHISLRVFCFIFWQEF